MQRKNAKIGADEARRLLDEARRYLDRKNLHQASGKGWHAAARMARAVAEAQGWRYNHHSNDSFHEVMNRAREMTGDDRFRTLSGRARELESAYFQVREGLDREVIQADLQDMARLVELLEPLAGHEPEEPRPEHNSAAMSKKGHLTR